MLFDVVEAPPSPTAPLVVALPYTGAGGRALAALHRRLPTGCGLALVDLPGHGRLLGEPCVSDPDVLVEELTRELAQLPNPLILVGYSLGGRLAYEAAIGLTEHGSAPLGLVLCGARAPSAGVGRPAVAHLPAGEPFLRVAVDLGVAAPEMLEEPLLAETFAAVLQADLTMVESFTHRFGPPLPIPVCVLGFTGDWLAPEPSLRAWDRARLACAPLHLRIDGGHLAVHERERDFADAVRLGLDHVLGAGPAPHTYEPDDLDLDLDGLAGTRAREALKEGAL
jgi:surfactin synthase thioesterase subunit